MELGSYSEDRLDQLLVRAESEIGTWRAVEMAIIVEKKRRKSHLADGYRSMSIGQPPGPMCRMRQPDRSVGRRLVLEMLRKWQKPWLLVRSPSTERNSWLAYRRYTAEVMRVSTSLSCVSWSLTTRG